MDPTDHRAGIPVQRLSPRTLTFFHASSAIELAPELQKVLSDGGLPATDATGIAGDELKEAIERYLIAVDRALEVAAASEPRRKQLEAYLDQLKPRREAAQRQGFQALVEAIDREVSRTRRAINEVLGAVLPPTRPEELSAPTPSVPAPIQTAPVAAPVPAPAPIASTPAARAAAPLAFPPLQVPHATVATTAAPAVPGTIVVAPVPLAVDPEVIERRLAEQRRRQEEKEQERIDFEIWARDCKDRAEALRHAAPGIPPLELRILAEQIAFEGRIRQFAHRDDLMRPEWSYLASICEKIFGTLTSIAKYHLNNIGIKIRGIRRDIHADWEAMLERTNQELAEYREQQRRERDSAWLEKQRAKEAQEQERVMEARREAAIQGLRPRLERETFEIVRCLENAETPPKLDLFMEDIKNYIEHVGIDEFLLKLVVKEPVRSLFSVGSDFRTLRKKLEKFEANGGAVDTSEEADSNRMEAVPEGSAPAEDGEAQASEGDDWTAIDEQLEANQAAPEAGEGAFEGLFSGCRGIMAGGKRKAVVEDNVKRFFKFDDFDWVETTRGAAIDRKIVTRVENGKVDIVFVLNQFLNKGTADALRDACKAAGIPCVHLAHGYNKGAICRGIEEYEEARLEPPILDRGA